MEEKRQYIIDEIIQNILSEIEYKRESDIKDNISETSALFASETTDINKLMNRNVYFMDCFWNYHNK